MFDWFETKPSLNMFVCLLLSKLPTIRILKVCLHFLFPATARLIAEGLLVKYLKLFSTHFLSCRHSSCTRCSRALCQLKFFTQRPDHRVITVEVFPHSVPHFDPEYLLTVCLSCSCCFAFWFRTPASKCFDTSRTYNSTKILMRFLFVTKWRK